MKSEKEKLLILPALNEGRFIDEIIARIKSNTDACVLVIDDGSEDDTVFKAEFAGADFIISHKKNAGYGKTLAEGFSFALEKGYKKVITMDCDAQHEPEMIPLFFRELKNADIVSGSRYMKESKRKSRAPAQRYRVNREITAEINKITGYNLTDAFCGFKAYNINSLKKFNPSQSGYGMPLQLWIQAARAGLKVKEIPVALIYHTRDSFPLKIRNPRQRLKYYRDVIKEELSGLTDNV
ncbi:MAG: glycosyltransferase family 2 protein [Elusimicrobiota bacterium]